MVRVHRPHDQKRITDGSQVKKKALPSSADVHQLAFFTVDLVLFQGPVRSSDQPQRLREEDKVFLQAVPGVREETRHPSEHPGG